MQKKKYQIWSINKKCVAEYSYVSKKKICRKKFLNIFFFLEFSQTYADPSLNKNRVKIKILQQKNEVPEN